MRSHVALRPSARMAALLAPVLALAIGCASQSDGGMGVRQPAASAPKAAIGDFGLDLAGMDQSVEPGDNFHDYANGTWVRTTEIPPDRPSWGATAIVRERALQETRALLDVAVRSDAPVGSAERKVGDYYASFMDEARIEALGYAPLEPQLRRIAAIRTPRDLAIVMAEANRDGIRNPFSTTVAPDLRANDRYAAYIRQGGLGLPDRDYYLDEGNPRFAQVRRQYRLHIANVLRLAGHSDPEGAAERIYSLEERLARLHWSRVETRQIDRVYNPITPAELERDMPGFDWPAFLEAAGIAGARRFIASQPSTLAGSARLAQSEPLDAWRDYLTFHTIKSSAQVLPAAMVAEDFAFEGQALTDIPQQRERWKRAVDLVNTALGEAVGQLYVARHFSGQAKAEANQLVANLVRAMDQRLAHLRWMAPETRARARTKLASMRAKIGYPDRWRDYSGLDIMRGDAFGNALRARRFEYQRNLAKLPRPVDRDEWYMTPQTVNAYANPAMNDVAFPAAILQPPFFDAAADPAVNYGSIGAAIGHEITHLFDDQGRKFDPDGMLREWWTPQDLERFRVASQGLIDQYSRYEPLAGVRLNGALTLGENIADIAGLMVAYDAYHLSLDGRPAPILGGLTGDQRFFIAYAQSWRSRYRDAWLQQMMVSLPHAPGHFRVNAVRNLDAWYRAFDVRPSERLYLPPDQRTTIW